MTDLTKVEIIGLHNEIVGILMSAQHPKMNGSHHIDPKELSRMFRQYHFSQQKRITELEKMLENCEGCYEGAVQGLEDLGYSYKPEGGGEVSDE